MAGRAEARYVRQAPIVVGVRDPAIIVELPDIVAEAELRYRYVGGMEPAVAFHAAPHARAILPSGRTLYLVDEREVPEHGRERALRTLEILAYAFIDPIARECTRGVFF